jgi:regulator of protease activity HflC (stomatin/prohibitin superfamily)
MLMLYGLGGINNIDPGEVGLKVKMLGANRGMQQDTLDTGTHWVEPFMFDVVVYDTRLKQYILQDMPASTRDGQPVQVDLSLEVGLADANVPNLHERIGVNYYDQVVYPATRSSIRNRAAQADSDVVYTGKGRKEIQDRVESDLKTRLTSFGVLVSVNLRKIEFLNEEFVNTIEEKARAAQKIEIETRNAAAAEQQAIRMANIAEGEKQKRIKAGEAQREELRLQGEGQRLQQEEQAKGILAVATAEAEGIRLKQEAVSGPGGATYASIRWAETLGPNVKVLGYPLGAPGTYGLFGVDGVLANALKAPLATGAK